MTDDPAQPWQPHDRTTGELRHHRVPTGLTHAGVELTLDVTADQEVAAEVVPVGAGVAT